MRGEASSPREPLLESGRAGGMRARDVPSTQQGGSPELVGRGAEVARLRALVGAAAAGRGGALVVRGEPGIGKTALLVDTASYATRGGMVVVCARGLEAEFELD